MDNNGHMNFNIKPWYIQKRDQIESIRSYIELLRWRLEEIQAFINDKSLSLENKQYYWRKQKLILAQLEDEYKTLKSTQVG